MKFIGAWILCLSWTCLVVGLSGCGDVLVTVGQSVEYRVTRLNGNAPIAKIGGRAQFGRETLGADTLSCIPLNPTDAAGAGRFVASQGLVCGVIGVPFGALLLESNLRAKDHVVGWPLTMELTDSLGADACTGTLDRHALLRGKRYQVEIIAIGKTKILQ